MSAADRAGSQVARLPPTAVEGGQLVFSLPDPDHEHERVSVWCDVELAPHGQQSELGMEQVDGGWALRIALPDLDCLEYLFDVDGELVPDPGNPDVVEGAFGPHSWLAMPGYQPPAWLDLEPEPGERVAVAEDVEVWQPAGAEEEELPLLVVHDGPEMDEYGQVTRWAATRPAMRPRMRPPIRVALLAPGQRDERYCASPAYAAELVGEVLPALTRAFPTRHRPVLLGQSLGGLAALHAAWLFPEALAGVMLQSGSFFTPVLDPMESGFEHFEEVTEFVASFHASTGTPVGFPPVAMTCGTAEENLANNRLVHRHLSEMGVDVTWGEVRQGHTWTCWRDCLEPHLSRLLEVAWH